MYVEDDETIRKWISFLNIVDKEELAIHLGVPSNIPEHQFENLIFNQLLIAASNPEIQKTFRTWSPSVLLALAQCGQLKSAFSKFSYEDTIQQDNISNTPSCNRESQLLAGALRCSQSSLLTALEERRRLESALAESERLRQDAVAARDEFSNRNRALELEGRALRERIIDLQEESRRIQMCVCFSVHLASLNHNLAPITSTARAPMKRTASYRCQTKRVRDSAQPFTCFRCRALEQSEQDRDRSVQLGEILSDRVGELEQELLVNRCAAPPPPPPQPHSASRAHRPIRGRAERTAQNAYRARARARAHLAAPKKGSHDALARDARTNTQTNAQARRDARRSNRRRRRRRRQEMQATRVSAHLRVPSLTPVVTLSWQWQWSSSSSCRSCSLKTAAEGTGAS